MIFGAQSMDWSTFASQWNVLAIRNLVLKRRNYWHLIIPYIIPVIAGCYILNQYNQPYNKPSEMMGVDYDLPLIYQNQSLKGVSNNFHLCVAPRDIEESFLNSIQASLSLYGQKRIVRISQFEDDDHLKERLLKIEEHNEPDCDAGVTIVGNISTCGTYIVHVPDDICSPILDKYCSYGIQSNIQQAVDNAFLQEWTGNSNFKQPSSKIHGFIYLHEAARSTMYQVIKLLLLLSLIPIFKIVTTNVHHEKCMKIKESMFLMGTKPSSYWSARLFGEITLFMSIILSVSIALFIARVSSITAIFLHFLLWSGLGCTMVVFAMALMRFSSTPQIANVLSIYFSLTALTDALNPNGSDGGIKDIDCFAMLASPVAYDIGFNKIMRENDFCGASTAILMIFFDFFLYSLVDFTLEYLFPYGITPPWGKLKSNGKNSESTKCEDAHEKEALIGSLSSSTDLDPWIKVEKIRKAHSWLCKPHIVLDEMTFTIFKGEVTCLLGHNGAGKSTLMKIISGVLTPDEGRITTATSLNLGVCPQENNLSDDLTTYEHLHYFGSLKGIPYMKLHLMVTTLLETFDLFNKRDTMSKMLSRGEKRMLCVAIAMIGDPKVLLLDEPSSGMSPPYRRQLWKILQDYTKSGRSVFFTTHDTDEAELFADRIALLYYGKLIYYGTTMDIKKQFGGGYDVRITLQSEPSLLLKSELVRLIKDIPSEPEMILKSDCEIVIKLHSFDAATCSDFLSKIEEQFKDFGSDCFTVSVSSLEEIYFLLAAKNSKWTSEVKKTARQNETEIPKFTYISSTWTNIKELIRARCRLILRRLYTLFPIILCIILLYSARCARRVSKETKEIFYASPKLYENEIIRVINASGKPFTDFEKSLSKLRMKFESVNSTASVGEKSTTETEIQNYNLSNETLEVSWNWTTYHKSPFALPVLQNLMSNVLWKTFDDKLGRELKIILQPITIIGQKYRFLASETAFTAMLISLFLTFAAISFGLEVVKEKETKVIWLLSRTRNNALPYWISTFVVQLALFSLSLFMLQNLMLIYGVPVFENFSVWIAFYLCIPGCLLTVYLIAQWFKIYKTAEVLMAALVVTVSMTIFFGSMIAVFADIPYIYTLNTLVLFLFPIYAPFGLIILLSEDETVESFPYGTHWKIVCGLIIPLSNLFYALLIIYVEKLKTFLRKKKIQVMNQEAWDKEHNPKSIVDLKSVRKAYTYRNCLLEKKKQVAIKDVSMSFLEGEIFALIGSNGAGKSTLMNLLSLNTGLTSGEISIREKYMESISYCPEKNTVWCDLTVEEELRLYAILNGTPIKYADQVVDNLMKDLLLQNAANRKTDCLSMSYQRKMSIALCLLGNSNLVLLDEPTTGMDPISKHFLWKLLHREFPATSKRTLILTIESSNEAEVNASRIGLFSDGNLRSLGTTEDLKKQFNKDFQLNIKMKNEDNKKLKSYLVSEIPEAVEKFHKGVMLQYYIPRQAFKSMSGLFTAVAKIQAFEGVETCLISECPLNEIILEILSQANKQVTGEDEYAI